MPKGGEVWIIASQIDEAQGIAKQFSDQSLQVQCRHWNDVPPDQFSTSACALLFLAGSSGVESKGINESAFRWLKWAGPQLRFAGQSHGAVLAAIIPQQGRFSHARQDSISCGLAGLVKTARHEWPEVACKVLEAPFDSELLVEELFKIGPIEVGLRNGDWHELYLDSAIQSVDVASDRIAPGELVIVSGGARGVTAACAIEMARCWRPTILLLGRTALIDEREWLNGIQSDADAKRAILAHASRKLSPREVESEWHNVLACREARFNISQMRDAGSQVEYRALDIRDSASIRATVEKSRNTFGPVRGLLHGAGVLADKRIEDKSFEQFADVHHTKVDGLNSLLAATEADPLAFIGLFSSSTGRFGRIGQADYAAANEVLNAEARRLAQQRPACRTVSFNWGPWDGGMVTPQLRKMFESEGVGVIPIELGAKFLVAELAGSNRSPEVVVLGPSPDIASAKLARRPVMERDVSLANCPVLRSHVINDRAIWPVALAVEWLGHAALHAVPGLRFVGCDELQVLHPIVLGEAASSVQLNVGDPNRIDSEWIIPVELHAIKTGGTFGACVRANVRLAPMAATPPKKQGLLNLPPFSDTIDAVYRDLLFHGPELQGIDKIVGCGPQGIEVVARQSPPASHWFFEPLRSHWLVDPLQIDCSFQAMIIWCWRELGAPSLPVRFTSLARFAASQGASTICCRITQRWPGRIQADIESTNAAGDVEFRITGYECVADQQLVGAFRKNRGSAEALH